MRIEGWEGRLASLIEASSHRRFEYGIRDCCLWAADAIEALTGRDPASAWRGTYSDEAGALRVLARILGRGVEKRPAVEALAEMVCAEIAAPEIDEAYARRGDIALVAGDLGRALGVVDLTGRHIVVIDRAGAGRLALAAGLRFWAVG